MTICRTSVQFQPTERIFDIQSHQESCFGGMHRSLPPVAMPPIILTSRVAQAFADLLPVLLCGEESATLAFEGLAAAADSNSAKALARIAEEERGHDALLSGIRDRLPGAQDIVLARVRARHFYRRLQERDPTRHLARITALDSAVCTIISALVRPGRGVSADPRIVARLRFIRREETGHVRIGIMFSTGLGPERSAIQLETRLALCALLAPYGDRFEALAVDPDALFHTLGTLPGILGGG